MAIVLAVLGLYSLVSLTTVFTSHVLDPYLRLNARVSGAVLGLAGESVTVSDESIRSERFSVRIVRGCDGTFPLVLFVAAVVAFPVSRRARLAGIALGIVLLPALNVVRIVTLYWVGARYPKAFATMHIDVWQALFIFVSLLLWILWAAWATRRRSAVAHASG